MALQEPGLGGAVGLSLFPRCRASQIQAPLGSQRALGQPLPNPLSTARILPLHDPPRLAGNGPRPVYRSFHFCIQLGLGLHHRSFLSPTLGARLISRLFLLLLTGILLVLPACAEENAELLHGTVSWVHDGDTLKVSGIGDVRLLGIDTPERKGSKRDRYLEKQGVPASRQREIYRAAKEYNIHNIKGQRVSLVTEQPPRDKYGRLLAYVYLQDGSMLNRVLLEQGLAVVYKRFSFKMKEDFLKVEEQARHEKRGLWQTLPTHPQEQPE